MKISVLIAILTGAFGATALSQFVGDCPPAKWDHPIWVTSVAGVVVDATGAALPKVQMTLQARKGKSFVDVEEFQTDMAGNFISRVHQSGEYRLVTSGPKGFCKLSLPVSISEKGWSRFKLALPAAASDTCQSYCEERARIEELKPEI